MERKKHAYVQTKEQDLLHFLGVLSADGSDINIHSLVF